MMSDVISPLFFECHALALKNVWFVLRAYNTRYRVKKMRHERDTQVLAGVQVVTS